jgi:tRNA modification GTPase
LAGRLDLTQAEAVLGVIDAKSSRQLQTALRQLAGGLSGPLSALRDQLLNVCADLEAGLDFVDEDIEFISSAEVARQLQSAHSVMTSLLENLATRRRQDQEPTIALRGSPNVGKSTLWNALLGHNEAIVSPIPGTTRDYLTGRADLGGMMCTLLDSAGIDPRLNSPIDHTSQQLADQLHREVDLVVLCLDSSRAMTDWERHELQTGTADLVVATKADRQQHEAFLADVREQFPSVTSACLVASRQAPGQRPQPAPPLLGISAVTGQGMSELRAALQSLLERRLAEESTLVSSTAARCQIQLRQATEAIERALGLALVSEGHELIAAELRETLTHLGQIVGAIYTDDILDRVFSRFCIGK